MRKLFERLLIRYRTWVLNKKRTYVLRRLKLGSVVVGDCWMWQGELNGKGYAKMDGRIVYKFSWGLFHGALKPGFVRHHSCLNKSCVNPDHLVAKTWLSHYRLHHRARVVRGEGSEAERGTRDARDGQGGVECR